MVRVDLLTLEGVLQRSVDLQHLVKVGASSRRFTAPGSSKLMSAAVIITFAVLMVGDWSWCQYTATVTCQPAPFALSCVRPPSRQKQLADVL